MVCQIGNFGAGSMKCKPRYHIFVCNIGSAILHFRMLHKYGQNIFHIRGNKCPNITHLLYYKNF